MRKNYQAILIFWLLPVMVYSQMSIDFENGSLDGWVESSPGRWAASSLEPIHGMYSLHHSFDNPEASHDEISIFLNGLALSQGTTTWRFQLRHGYPPSSNNHWSVFLFADQEAAGMHPDGSAYGYAVGVNYLGTDDILKLWRVKGSEITELINTGLNWQLLVGTTQPAGIEVSRTAAGVWTLKADVSGGFEDLETLGQATDMTFNSALYFGVHYKYSSSQDQLLWLDDLQITGVFEVDDQPPAVDHVEVIDAHTMEVHYTETVQSASASDIIHYSINRGIGTPAQVTRLNSLSYSLRFEQSFIPDITYQLSIQDIEDPAGNKLVPVQLDIVYHQIRRFEVLINEIMADPSPAIGLPDAEYIELVNHSEYPARLGNWKLEAGNEEDVLPDYILMPDEYVVLCSSVDAGRFPNGVPVLSIPGFPVLSNTGESLVLKDRDETMISFVHYTDTWYGENFKSEGGWSLERIDPRNPCQGASNWIASKDSEGGTPGKLNSVSGNNPDMDSPSMGKILLSSDSSLWVWFSEPLDIELAEQASAFLVTPDLGHPSSIIMMSPDFRVASMTFRDTFRRGTVYTLHVQTNITDCAGNILPAEKTGRFAIPEEPQPLDLVINEVLFNPFPGNVDYVEIYNRSDKVINLVSAQIANRDEVSQALDDPTLLIEDGYLFFPGSYLVLTTRPDLVMQEYFTHDPDAFLRMGTMPSFNDDAGNVVLLWQWSSVLDEFRYEEDMHFPLIIDREGVSLERIHMDRPTQDRSNWHSAAETAGYGTPGCQNSQYLIATETDHTFSVEPEIFSPDNDGYKDVVDLHYQFKSSGYVATITLFDARGRIVRKLLQNALLGTEGYVTWDGLDDQGVKAPIGIYLFYIEVFKLKGEVIREKMTCVLAGKLSG